MSLADLTIDPDISDLATLISEAMAEQCGCGHAECQSSAELISAAVIQLGRKLGYEMIQKRAMS